MCECGCAQIDYQWKVIDKSGDAWLFGVYPSCRNCAAPIGLAVLRVKKSDKDTWRMMEVNQIGEFQVSDDGMGGEAILSTEVVRRHVERMLIGWEPDGGKVDECDADVMAEEMFPDLREVVFATQEEFSKNRTSSSPGRGGAT